MTHALIQLRARRVLPALAALTLATGALTGCSTGAADITAPTVQESDVREGEAPRVEAAVTTTSGKRSAYLLSTGKDDETKDDK